jgi:hypothetical protein
MKTYEVQDGRLIVDGRSLPLNKGLVLVALLKAGWRGFDGPLSADLGLRTLEADPRIGALVLRAG